jgi:hypothetical protein
MRDADHLTPALPRDRRGGGGLIALPALGFRRKWGLMPSLPRSPLNPPCASLGRSSILLAREPAQAWQCLLQCLQERFDRRIIRVSLVGELFEVC